MDESKVRKINKLISHWKDNSIDYEEAINYRNKALDLISKYGYDPCDFEFSRGYDLVPVGDNKNELVPIKTKLPTKTTTKPKRTNKLQSKIKEVAMDIIKMPSYFAQALVDMASESKSQPVARRDSYYPYEYTQPVQKPVEPTQINVYGNNNNVYIIKK